MDGALAAYATLFAWSFLAATVVPLGSEPALFAVVFGGYPFWTAVGVATTGNVLGACTTYWLGHRAAAALEARGFTRADDSRAGRLLRRYGQPALLLSWVPLIGDALVAAAGAVRTPLLPFVVWVSIGKAARYAAVAWGAGALR
ncbi:MAG TPA: YqaA family protein [Vicinamibacterales bacterium]|nr:YqaA family protein [Vicinamibacterales bacterium]